MIKPNAGVTEYLSSIKKTDEDKLKRRLERDRERLLGDIE